MAPPIVELVDVGVRFGTTPVLTGVSLEVQPGSVIGVAGPNGAGKTTLLGVIATLIRPTSGSGTVLGADLGTPQTRRIRSRIGWSGHDPGLYPELTLGENLRFSAAVTGTDPHRADASLAAVGLAAAAGRRADRSSNGMQRRVDLARLLMLQPDLVLLDEAHAGLDQAAEEIIDEVLARTRRRGGAAILVSHDRHRLERQVDAVVRLEDGSTG
jgi:heme exporter protein A